MHKRDRQFLRTKLKTSYELVERGKKVAKTHYVAGYFTDFIFFDRGIGAIVWDPDGNEYIDYAMGLGPLVLGHSHPVIVDAICQTVQTGAVHSFGDVHEIRFAELLVDAIPCADAVAFTNSGTEATMHAIKIARAFTNRVKIAKFEGCYHGTHDYAQVSGRYAALGPREKPQSAADFNGIPQFVVDSVITLALNQRETFDTIKENKDDLAAVIVEPLPLICPMDFSNFLRELRQVTRECEIPLIFDEVITGFRLGYSGYQGKFDLVPDLATYGKIIGGGLPVGAIAGKQELMEYLDFTQRVIADKKVSIVGTFNGNRVTAAAGIAVLKYLREHREIYADMERKAHHIREQVEAHAAQIGFPFQTLGMGSVFVPYFTDDPILQPRDTRWAVNSEKIEQLRKRMLKYGVALGDVGMFFLSAAHTDADCEKTIQAFNKCLDEMY